MLLGQSKSRVKRATGEQRRTRQVCAGPHDKRGARLLYRHEDPLVLYRYSARYNEHARRSGFAANCLHARVEFRSLKNWSGVRETIDGGGTSSREFHHSYHGDDADRETALSAPRPTTTRLRSLFPDDDWCCRCQILYGIYILRASLEDGTKERENEIENRRIDWYTAARLMYECQA